MVQKRKLSRKTVIDPALKGPVTEVVTDTAEVILDSVLSEGVLKEIPVLGTIIRLAKAGKSISDQLILNKIQRFLFELQKTPPYEREQFIQKYGGNAEEQKVLGENLLLALERLDDVEKPRLLALFFSSYMREQIDKTMFTRLARAQGKITNVF